MNTIENKHNELKSFFDENNFMEKKYRYQTNLTKKLDSLPENTNDFDQNIINEILLWKTNRYALLNEEILEMLNKIDPSNRELDREETKNVLKLLLNTKGIGLPMASTILRFRNPYIYQIIDQRAYRVIGGIEDFDQKQLPRFKNPSNEEVINKQISLYLKYLDKLRNISEKENLPFELLDRILYEFDKYINKKEKIKY